MASATDMKLPPSYPTVSAATYDELKLIILAREIAIGLKPIDQILKDQGISLVQFEQLGKNKRFVEILSAELSSWNGAINTTERVKVKAAAMLEEWMPELYARMNDRSESLMHKIEGGKLIKDLAGLGLRNELNGNGKASDRVSITINLGNDVKLEYQKSLPDQVIDVSPVTEGTDA